MTPRQRFNGGTEVVEPKTRAELATPRQRFNGGTEVVEPKARAELATPAIKNPDDLNQATGAD